MHELTRALIFLRPGVNFANTDGTHGFGSPSGSGAGQPLGLSYLCALEQLANGAGYSTGSNASLAYTWRY